MKFKISFLICKSNEPPFFIIISFCLIGNKKQYNSIINKQKRITNAYVYTNIVRAVIYFHLLVVTDR